MKRELEKIKAGENGEVPVKGSQRIPAVASTRTCRFLKYTANYFICLGMVLVLSFLIITAVLKATILNPGFGIRCLDNSNYIESCADDMEKSFVNLGQSAGIPENILLKSVSRIKLRRQVSDFFRAASAYLSRSEGEFEFAIENKEFENKLVMSINTYAGDKDIELDSAANAGIGDFVGECAGIYESGVIIQKSMLPQIRKLVAAFVNRSFPAVLIFLFLFAVQLFINRDFAQTLRWMGIGFIVLGLVILLLSLLFAATGVPGRLSLEPGYFKEFVASVLSGMVFNFALSGGALLASGIVFNLAFLSSKKQ